LEVVSVALVLHQHAIDTTAPVGQMFFRSVEAALTQNLKETRGAAPPARGRDRLLGCHVLFRRDLDTANLDE
jgi:hypothetical protein